MTILSALNRKQTFGFLTVALLLAGGIALAAPAASNAPSKPGAPTDQRRGPGHRGHDPFARWDKDHDGKIALKDLPARAQSHLGSVDTNKDGTLTRDEFEKGREQLRATRAKELDSNQDGKVSEDERKAGMRARFAERFTEDDKNKDGFLTADELPKEKFNHLSLADTNKDQKLSKAEIESAFTNGTLGPRGPMRDGKGPKNAADRKAHMQQRFNSEDTNHDGFLVQSEVPNRWDRLQNADANKDSKVTLAELQAAFESGKMGPPQGRGRGHGHGNGRGHGPAESTRK